MSLRPHSESVATSLFEQRVTYKYHNNEEQENVPNNKHNSETSSFNKEAKTCKQKVLSFSIVRAWQALSHTKCKKWDDRELDVFEGIKFFSFFLG